MAKKSIYTRRLGEAVARDARASLHGKYHVVSSNANKWAVVSEGSTRPVRLFSTQRQARTFAKQHALSKSYSEVVIHGRDGMIRERITLK